MKQGDLNAEMQELGVRRYRSNLSKARSGGRETITGAGQRVLEKATEQLSKGIKDWKRHARSRPGRLHRVYPYLKPMKDSVVALVVSRAILDGISTVRSVTGLANHVGRLVEDEVKVGYLKKNHKVLWKQMAHAIRKQPSDHKKLKHIRESARFHDVALPKWPVSDRIAVGLVLVELFRQHTDIIEFSNRTNAIGREVSIVRATQEFMDWLRKSHDASEILRPVYMPMVTKPQDWTSIWTGGYFGECIGGYRPLVKATNRQYLTTLDNLDLTNVYSAVNHVQGTAWQVNRKVLEVVKHCWENNLPIGEIPDRNGRPIPPKPVDINTNKEARRAWRKQAAFIHYENEADRSKLYSIARTLQLAEKFESTPFWMPQELDFRGRIYPKPIYLHNQGSDWQRAMLKFSNGKSVDAEAKRWLAIHGANCAGIDKVPFADRIRWVADNHDMILRCGNDPLANMEWAKMDKPFSFLAFCFEWAELAKNPSHICALPCHLDGSNNGLQLFSLMMRDIVGASATNCLPSAQPNDIYEIVAMRTVQKLLAINDPVAQAWLDFGIDRKTTKRVVMCLPYGLSKYSARTYVREWYTDKARKTGRLPFTGDAYNQVRILTDLIWESISETVSSATSCMDWLRKVSDLHVEANIPVRWTAPSGLLIEQGYRKLSRVTVKTSIGRVIRQHVIVVDQEDLSKVRNRNGISPNIIHSLDAALLMRCVNMLKWQGVDSMSCIHDSIGVVPADVGKLSLAIRKCAVEMFSEPILEQLHAEMKSYFPAGIELPPPPQVGTMDLAQLLDAEYFFA